MVSKSQQTDPLLTVSEKIDSENGHETGERHTGADKQADHTGRFLLPPSLLHLSIHPQIFIFGLLVVPVWTCKPNRCYDEVELNAAVERKLRSHYPQPLDPSPAVAPDSPASCPVELYQREAPRHLSGRSLSPWRYV